jgi:hypothetical protein
LQGNSELVVLVIDTLNLVLSVCLELGSEVVLNTQQGFVNDVFVGRTGRVGQHLAFGKVVATRTRAVATSWLPPTT